MKFDLPASPSSDDAKQIVFDLPPGMLGDVHAVPKCSAAQLNADGCPAATKIGTTTTDVETLIPLTVSGDVYAMAPQGTEVARMGVVLRPGVADKIKLQASVRLRPDDLGLRATLDDLPRKATNALGLGLTLDIRMKDLEMKLLGTSGGGVPFISAPTSCGAATTTVYVASYNGQVTSASKAYTPTNCAAVPFAPSASIAVDPAVPDSPALTAVTLTVPETATPRVQSQVRTATVALPEGMEINPAAASAGLGACTDAEFGLGGAAIPACPASSVVGDVAIDNPQVGTLSGTVYLGTSAPGSLMRLLVMAQRSGAADDVRVKLTGAVTADPATGRVTARLDDIPQVPFRTFTLRLRGGAHGILRTPRACGDTTLGTALAPWSGAAAASPGATLRIGSGCADPARFAPAVSLSPSTTQAGASTSLQMTMARNDGDARFAGARVSLPDGLMGILSGPLCTDVQACGADTRVGGATALVGTGPAPMTLPGDLYLTPPAQGGLAGLALVIDAKVGPLDLGRVAVPMELQLRAGGAGIDVVAGDIPRRVQGIPFDLRAVTLTIDRPGFLLNPTGCEQRAASAVFTSDLGGTASAGAPYSATGCRSLKFKPRVRMGFTGKVGKNDHPGVQALLTQPTGQANARRITMLLPAGVAPDADRLRNACPLADAQAGTCPKAARIGSAAATTPALPQQLRGDVWFVTAPGSVLPELFVRLGGPARIDLRGTVSFKGKQAVVTFAEVPDVPLTRFALRLSGGTRGVLTTTKNLCAKGKGPRIATDVRAHSGSRRRGAIAPAVQGCRVGTGGAKVSLRVRRLRGGRPLLELTARAGDTNLRKVRVTLPTGLRLDTKRARRLATVKGTSRGRGAVKVGRRVITLDLGAKGARKLTVRFKRGAVRAGGTKTRRARSLKVRVRATPANGLTTDVHLRVRPSAR